MNTITILVLVGLGVLSMSIALIITIVDIVKDIKTSNRKILILPGKSFNIEEYQFSQYVNEGEQININTGQLSTNEVIPSYGNNLWSMPNRRPSAA